MNMAAIHILYVLNLKFSLRSDSVSKFSLLHDSYC